MKTTPQNTTSTTARQHNSTNTPFFSKEGSSTFFGENEQPFFQAKLTIGKPNDKYEQEADAVADQVVQDLSTEKTIQTPSSSISSVQLKCNDCEQEERLQKKEEEGIEQEPNLQRKPLFESGGGDETSVQAQLDPTTPTLQAKCNDCEQEDRLQKKEEEGIEEEPNLQRKPIFESGGEDDTSVQAQLDPTTPTLQAKCNDCEQEDRLQKKEEEGIEEEPNLQRKPIFGSGGEDENELIQEKSATNSSSILPNLQQQLNSSKGKGQSLSPDIQQSMGQSMGADFSGVRVHTGSDAVQMNRDLGAQAFTHGSDIYFNKGKYNTESKSGQHLLAHELTHTVQQGGALLKTKSITAYRPNYRVNSFNAPNIQAFGLSDLGNAISRGARFVGDLAGDAVEWVGDRVEDVIEMGADAFMAIIRQVAPKLAEIIQDGPGGLISKALSEGIQTWLSNLFGGFDLGQFITDIRTNLTKTFNLIKGIVSGDEASCKAFNNAIDAMRGFISDFMDNPFFQAIKAAFDTIKSFLSKVVDLVIAPIFDTIMEVAGEAFSVVKKIAGTISGWLQAVKGVLEKAWSWVMEQLGFSGDGEGGIWESIKGFANDIWKEIKATFAPIIKPLKTIVGILLMMSPIGPVVIAIRYGPQVIEAIKWLWNNRNNPNIIKDAREQMGDTILPQLLTAGETFITQISNVASQLLGHLVELGSGLLELIGGLTGIPLLEMARSFVQNLATHVQTFTTWVQESFQGAIEAFKTAFNKIKAIVKPYIEILSSIGLAILNPPMIPIIIAGWAWRALPDCYKPPIVDFLLDGVIAFLEALPVLPFLGVLWPLLQPFIVGFLREFRGRSDEEKIAITNKFAKIISGASIEFIIGFVSGFLQGIWEGLTDPFMLMFMALKGLSSLTNWFLGLFEEEPAQKANTSTDTTPTSTPTASNTTSSTASNTGTPQTSNTNSASQNQAEFSGRMIEMGHELSPHVNEVTENFMPAVEEQFQGGEGMTFDDLVKKMGSMWESAQKAISGAGKSLAEKMVGFFMQDSAERKMGHGIGWLTGMIVFEVALGILTAGTYTAAQPVMKTLQFFAKILDWTGAALGAAFKALTKLGGLLMKLLQKLRAMLSKAGGAVGRVFNALQEIGERVIRYGQELLGRLTKKGGQEASETAVERTAKETAEVANEKAAKEGAEIGTERTTKETAETAGEETTEQSAKQVDEATKAAERPAAIAAAKTITDTMDAAPYTPVASLLAALNTLKSRFKWIKRFEAKPKGLGRYAIHMIASDYIVDGNFTEQDSPTTRQTEFNDKIETRRKSKKKEDRITQKELETLREYNQKNPSGGQSIDEILAKIRDKDSIFDPSTGLARSKSTPKLEVDFEAKPTQTEFSFGDARSSANNRTATKHQEIRIDHSDLTAKQREKLKALEGERKVAKQKKTDVENKHGGNEELYKNDPEWKQANQDMVNASEALGDQATDAVVKSKFPGAKRLDTDIPGAGKQGQFDGVYEHNGKIYIIEAKGGGSSRGSRNIGGGKRAEQGTYEYVDSIIDNMEKAAIKNGNPDLWMMADRLKRARKSDRIELFQVSQKVDELGNLKPEVIINKFDK